MNGCYTVNTYVSKITVRQMISTMENKAYKEEGARRIRLFGALQFKTG